MFVPHSRCRSSRFLPHQFFVALGQTVLKYVWESQIIFWNAGAPPPWDGVWLARKNMLLPTYVNLPNVVTVGEAVSE